MTNYFSSDFKLGILGGGQLGKMLLSRHGFEVATAGCLGELARKPALLHTNLIVLDFGLGDFTGLDILDYLYDLKMNAPILLLSSCSDETAAHAIAEGVRLIRIRH